MDEDEFLDSIEGDYSDASPFSNFFGSVVSFFTGEHVDQHTFETEWFD